VKVVGTAAAVHAVEQVRRRRTGTLVFTIGTGCCESTAPFLFEDFWPGPDHEMVGEVGTVPVYAPAHLRNLYLDHDPLAIDVDEDAHVESFSIEAEYGSRFVLRTAADRPGAWTPTSSRRRSADPAEAPTTVSALRPIGPQALPDALQRLRLLQDLASSRPEPPSEAAPPTR
jgi:uncharacterized protein (DUF779 family)